jgi:transcriptional regulator with XRE-family HTH domain
MVSEATAATSARGKEGLRASARRPIGPDEVPFLEALGAELRALREAAHLSRPALAWAAEISPTHLRYLEEGVRRTRRSTLGRVAAVLAESAPVAASANDLADYLASLAGPALAPESDYAERVHRRRRRRVLKAERLVEQDLPLAERMARPLAQDMASEYIRRWRRGWDLRVYPARRRRS